MITSSPLLHLLLLKDKREPDTYAEAFQRQFPQHHVIVSYLPVLDITPTLDSEHSVRSAIVSSNVLPLGIICTSRHAAEIVGRVLSSCAADHPARLLPCFVVGSSTADPLRNNGCIIGETSGNAANLTSLVVDHYTHLDHHNQHDHYAHTTSSHTTSSYIFFCGTTRKHTLPSALTSHNIPFIEIHLYRSVPRSTIRWPLSPPDWVVFFSPLGVRAAVASSREARETRWPLAVPKHAAIGPTTSACMSSNYGLSVEVVANKPHPKELSSDMYAWEEHRKDNELVPASGKWVLSLVAVCGDVVALSVASKGWTRLLYPIVHPTNTTNTTNTTSHSPSSIFPPGMVCDSCRRGCC